MVSLKFIRWIVIYLVDSTIQRLKNQSLMHSAIQLLNNWGQDWKKVRDYS